MGAGRNDSRGAFQAPFSEASLCEIFIYLSKKRDGDGINEGLVREEEAIYQGLVKALDYQLAFWKLDPAQKPAVDNNGGNDGRRAVRT